MNNMDYTNVIVNKPWGYEYLVYENEEIALWHLHINQGESTSMHCHPKKTTGLILLNGQAILSFLADKRIIEAPDKVMIRRGLFHQTKALSEGGVDLFEIETPNDKSDLVRLKDNYGRENKAYETTVVKKDNKCLWVEENLHLQMHNFKNCNIRVEKIKRISDISCYTHEEDHIIVFLKGGLVRNIDGKEHLVTVPGDVGFRKVIDQVASELDGVAENTLIMTIYK